MTPEERASQIILPLFGLHGVRRYKEACRITRQAFANEIRAAVGAEREACAKVAQGYGGLLGGRQINLRGKIAAAIRARKQDETADGTATQDSPAE